MARDFFVQSRGGVRKGKRWNATDHMKLSNGPEAGGPGFAVLSVEHSPGSNLTTHGVTLNRVLDDGSSHHQSLSYRPAKRGKPSETTIYDGRESGDAKWTPADPPSERLQQLIAQHHLHPDQWPILLDALQEEYPQLWEAIDAHRGARAAAESNATHYARAFTEIAK